jgi:molybdopterin molybdotransferase
MLELEEARRRIIAAIKPLSAEAVPLKSAAGRVLAIDATASVDLPAFDNSAMDGYAVRAEDIIGAKPDSPVPLKVVGCVAAGEMFPGRVKAGETVRLFTGSMLPSGADAVVMQEDTRSDTSQWEHILILDSAKPWENVRFRGEDVKRGVVLVRAGERITPGRLGLLASAGVEQITAHRKPVVALMATGSELVETGQPLSLAKIYESNRLMLAPLMARSGVSTNVAPLVPDTLEATKRAIAEAFAECDGVVTSGGVSVGEFDFIKTAFEQLGGSLEFWKVSVKPGKPFVFGRWGDKFLFGLPGNPVSALVTFLLLVRPALWRLQGATELEPSSTHCLLADSLTNPGDRRHFIRVHVDEHGKAHSTGTQASHRLGSLAAANGLVDVPPASTIAAGTMVPFIRFDD